MGSDDGDFLSWARQVLSDKEDLLIQEVVEALKSEDVTSHVDLKNISADVVASIPDLSAGKRACVNRLHAAATKRQKIAATEAELPFPPDWPSEVLNKVRMALEGHKGFYQLVEEAFGDNAFGPHASLRLQSTGDALLIVLSDVQDTVEVVAMVSNLKGSTVPTQLMTQLADAMRTSAELPAENLLKELPRATKAAKAIVQQAQMKQQQACQAAAMPRTILQRHQQSLSHGGDLMQIALAQQLSRNLSHAAAAESEVQQKRLKDFVDKASVDSLIYQLPNIEAPCQFTGDWINARKEIRKFVKNSKT